jgi:hypothetical protein
MNYWQFKAGMKHWKEEKGGVEFNNTTKDKVFYQDIQTVQKKLKDNKGDIVFYYNNKGSKEYPCGIFLVCEIVSKMDKKYRIKLKVLKDLKESPYDYSNDYNDLHLDINTTKLSKHPQPKIKIDDIYDPQKLYDLIMNNEYEEFIPEEINQNDAETLIEGAKKQITVNAYERNSKARSKCINKHGYICAVCNFDFEKTYGDIGKKFIHIHHLKEISSIAENYEVDPKKDLIPVCPNCHAMLHKKKPAYTINEMKKILNKNKSDN